MEENVGLLVSARRNLTAIGDKVIPDNWGKPSHGWDGQILYPQKKSVNKFILIKCLLSIFLFLSSK